MSSCVIIATCNANETMLKTTLYSLQIGQWRWAGRAGRAAVPGPPPLLVRIPVLAAACVVGTRLVEGMGAGPLRE